LLLLPCWVLLLLGEQVTIPTVRSQNILPRHTLSILLRHTLTTLPHRTLTILPRHPFILHPPHTTPHPTRCTHLLLQSTHPRRQSTHPPPPCIPHLTQFTHRQPRFILRQSRCILHRLRVRLPPPPFMSRSLLQQAHHTRFQPRRHIHPFPLLHTPLSLLLPITLIPLSLSTQPIPRRRLLLQFTTLLSARLSLRPLLP
jgi:hypothetical protein